MASIAYAVHLRAAYGVSNSLKFSDKNKSKNNLYPKARRKINGIERGRRGNADFHPKALKPLKKKGGHHEII